MPPLLTLPIGQISHIPIICGPTAAGKSNLAMNLCKELSADLVSMDSMQLYRGMDIGTAKPSLEEGKEVRHHLIDVVSPNESFSVSGYLKHAYLVIEQLLGDEILPVFCGGTGQYATSLFEGIEYSPITVIPEVRKEVTELYNLDNGATAYRELLRVDPKSAEKIHPNNAKRVIRALEVYRQSNQTLSEYRDHSLLRGPKYPFKVFVVNIPRDSLYKRINDRVDQMIENGLEQEVSKLLSSGVLTGPTATQAIGYKEFIDYFNGLRSYEETIMLIKQRSRNYAKRQLTWYRKMKETIWISPDDMDAVIDAITLDYA
ncbi:MAG: tRNA (adenosine(37)-N6)-dimethylallyltransferase MiaA [Clostridiales bacterium]|nr:tRNA (adenosine(37)-N6)-dimethylallyltransferase MiaA [Clostridiales bacterium]